eukprot:gb/GEZN01001124.1/.p1 GENE.gb/GEZN01001124.1/~~gb/GEZN01001124.1/.p1  ORF type:complete len:782 (-),score=148.50 gb/GEZN01001124.1/:667-3012(-)
MQARVTALPCKCKTGTELDEEEQKFVEKTANGHNIYFRDWVSLVYSSKDPKKRILVVTNFRVFTVKQAVVGKSVRQSFPILDLKRMTADASNPKELLLEFGSFSACTVTYEESCAPIALAILFAFQAISYGRPQENMPKLSLPPSFWEMHIPPNPDAQDGFLATYLAHLDHLDKSIESRLPVLENVMTCFQRDDHVCNLSEAFKNLVLDKGMGKEVGALAATIRDSQWFTAVAAVNFKLGNGGMTALAHQILETPTSITRMDLVNMKCKGPGFAAFSKSLAVGKHRLEFLNLNKNELGDTACAMICDALLDGKQPLQTLCLRDCGLGPKGIRSVAGLFTKPGYWSGALSVLDVSCNQIKRGGNQALAEWLAMETCALRELYVVQAGVEGETLFPAIQKNKRSKLAVLNVSSNPLSKKALVCLADLIQTTTILTQISLSNLGMGKKEFLGLLEAAFLNPHKKVRFLMDCSNNQGLGKCGKEVLDLMTDIKKKVSEKTDKLEALSLNDCALGSDGVVSFCVALQGITMSSLGLSKNVKEKLFSSDVAGKKTGEAVATFIKETPSLSELTLAGTGGYALKVGVEPVLQALLDGKCNLAHLDLSGNRMGDKLMQKLAKAVGNCDALESLAIDGNELGTAGLLAIRDAILKSTSLLYWVTPSSDLKALVTKIKPDKGPEFAKVFLQDILHTIEHKLEQNQLAASWQGGSGNLKSAFPKRDRSNSQLSAMSLANDVGPAPASMDYSNRNAQDDSRTSTIFEAQEPGSSPASPEGEREGKGRIASWSR